MFKIILTAMVFFIAAAYSPAAIAPTARPEEILKPWEGPPERA
jgi:hypothetical protein